MTGALTIKARALIANVFKIRALATVPGIIALVIWGIAIAILYVEARLQAHLPDLFRESWFWVNGKTASAVLSVIAAAAITTLGLVYSMVLIVFTLATGNIGPRLLQRFTEDRVNQVTAGLLGATFLVSLTVLHQTSEIHVPVISVNFAFVLTVLSLLQLIFFVQAVSRTVMIDEEIASISRRLEHKLSQVVKDSEAQNGVERSRLKGKQTFDIASNENGYLSTLDIKVLHDLACEHDLEINLRLPRGTFVLKGQTFMHVVARTKLDDDCRKTISDTILGAVGLTQSRGAADDIEYSVNVLVEVALRALSPGVNDTFTAISCIDRVTGAINDSVQFGLDDPTIVDEEGVVRVNIPGYSADRLIDAVFHPLRRAASANLLMLIKLADALSRLNEVAAEKLTDRLKRHGELLYESYAASDPLPADLAFLKAQLEFVPVDD